MLTITSNVDQVARAFDDMARRQVPFATSLTLNRLAEHAKGTLKVEMNRVFDRPKPFIVNSIFIKKSTKSNLVAVVFHSDKASPYLRAEIEGGTRDEKPFEIKLGREILVPTNNAPRDSYGGVPRAFIARVLSEARPLRSRTEYAIVPPGSESELSPGIYQRREGRIFALFLFKSSASYQKRYDMEGVVKRVVAAEMPRVFPQMMDYALSTAKVTLR